MNDGRDERGSGLELDNFEALWAADEPDTTRGAAEPTRSVTERRDPAPDDDLAPRRVRRSTRGRRSSLRRRRRQRSALRTVGYTGVTLVVAAAAVLAFELFTRSDGGVPTPDETLAAQPAQDPQPTVVFATFDEADRTAGANLVAIGAHDRLTGESSLVFVPTSTVADVPGHGLLSIGRAFAFGEGPLLDATLDNLLGVDLDHVVAVSEQGWSSLFTRIGGLSLDVPERLVSVGENGSSEVRFRPGEQFLDGPRLSELLTFQAAGETVLAQLPRAQLVLTAMLDALAEDPSRVDAVFADGAPMLDTTAPNSELRTLIERLAEASASGDLVVRTLPVNPIGSGEDDTYRLDTERARRLVEENLSGSVPVGSQDAGRLLQILNGHGAPGIGGEVAKLLLPHGFKVVLTGNADDFDYEHTRVVVYRDDRDQLEAAEQIVDILGVGRVERSFAPQSVVDITIVVGQDFTEDR